MTVSYSDQFWKLLCRWKGSLWKTIWKDLIVFLLLYYAIRLLYRMALDDEGRETFEKLIVSFDEFTEHIPLTFMLGFYVGMIVTRWWDQFQRLSWPDNFLYWVSAYIRGADENCRLVRRTIARYCLLSSVLAWRSISLRVLKRFPTLEHIVKLGLMTEEEKRLHEKVSIQFDPHKQWFVPLNWVMTLLVNSYDGKRISHVNELVTLLNELQRYRHGFTQLFIYDWITIPLVYTQVAVVATYGYFALCLLGRQFIDPSRNVKGHEVDMYFPFFTVLQFLFYVGWLKVGEDLMNPFGEDDEDFEFNYIIDRNLEMSYLIVDELHAQLPPLQETAPELGVLTKVLPHTVASAKIQDKCPMLHVGDLKLTADDQKIVAPHGTATHGTTSILRTSLAYHSWLSCAHRMIVSIRRRSKTAPIVDSRYL